MEIADIVAKLAKLQIEQNYLIRELSNKTIEDKTPAPKPVNNKILVGDHVILLTGGILCNKGDKGLVTKVTDSIVHFTVLRNKHNTYKKYKNVRKVQQE
jgi:hypothetical protein